MKSPTLAPLAALLLALGATSLPLHAQSGRIQLVDRVVAVVNDEVITRYELNEQKRAVLAQLKRQGVAPPPEAELDAQVLERFINEKVQLQYAKEYGIRADDEVVNASLQRIAAENKMSMQQFAAALRNDGVTIEKFRDELKNEIIINRVRDREIESRVVVVRDDFQRDLGVRWGVTAVDDRGSGIISTTGSATGNDTIVGSAISNINKNGNAFPVTTPKLDDRFNVNLPVANPTGRLAVALLNENYLVDLELSALQAEGRGEVISSPRVITANQKEAFIKQGVEIPYQEASSSGATTTQFKEAVLSLTVTPQITPDDRIIMDLKVTKDSVGEVITNERGGQVPSIDTRSVETQVLVNNGQTVVLGGIYETEQGEDYRKVPFLGDIPGLGYLFRSSTRVSKKSELLIFVTPKILKEGSSIY